jgi:hypothetical protein
MKLASIDVDIADDFAMPQLAPSERDVNVFSLEERFSHLAISPDDADPMQAAGTAPEMDANIVYMAGVVRDPLQAVVK